MISKVSPCELIRRDFERLVATEQLNTTSEIAELLFVQSLEGRAHNGAGSFQKMCYVNTTIDDIVRALKLNPDEIKKKRQRLIDDIVEFVRDTIEGRLRRKLLNLKGEPLLGIPDFKAIEVDPYEVLKGIYIGGLRDDPQTRKAAEDRHNIVIGYGKCYPVNVEIMERLNLDGEILAHQPHADSLADFKKNGLIIADGDLSKVAPDKIRYLYIRHALGPGQSDDAAMVATGLLYGRDMALGIFLADAIDTLEKYVHAYHDQDDDLAYYIGKNFATLGVSMETVYEIAYLAAVPEGQEEEIPDSSLRYFLSKDKEIGQCAFESHLNFIQGKPYFPMLISYNKVLSSEFYRYIKHKVASVKGARELITSAALVRELDAPVDEFLGKPAVVVNSGLALKEAIGRMRSRGAEFIVIQDEQNVVKGVVSMNDLLKVMINKEGHA